MLNFWDLTRNVRTRSSSAGMAALAHPLSILRADQMEFPFKVEGGSLDGWTAAVSLSSARGIYGKDSSELRRARECAQSMQQLRTIC